MISWNNWQNAHPNGEVAISRISGQLFPVNNSAQAIFDSLCLYGRTRFTYVTVATIGGSLGAAIEMGLLNCQSASELVIGLFLYRNQGVEHQALPTGIHGGDVPVVTPLIEPHNCGMRIQLNVLNSPTVRSNRMLFNGGHWVAGIGGVQFDLCTGKSGVNLAEQFIQAVAAVDRQTYTCLIQNKLHTFTRLRGTTGGGLSEFSVEPAIQ